MKQARLWLSLSPILFALAIIPVGCGSEPDPGPDVTGPGTISTTTTPPTTTPPSTTPPDGQPPTTLPPVAMGFPCDVHAVLQTHCASCHAGALYYGPNFDSRDDMFIPAIDLFLVPREGVKPGTFGEHVVTALRDDTMPPVYPATASGRPTAAERDLVIGWLVAGMPAGDCGTLTPVR